MEIFRIGVLVLSGLALFYASSMRLISPAKGNFLQIYLQNPANQLETDIDLVNEIRGVGSVMLFGGLIVLLGAVMPMFRQTSFVVAIVIFVGVSLGRLISMGIDGRPNKDVIRGAVLEIVLGALNAFCLVTLLM